MSAAPSTKRTLADVNDEAAKSIIANPAENKFMCTRADSMQNRCGVVVSLLPSMRAEFKLDLGGLTVTLPRGCLQFTGHVSPSILAAADEASSLGAAALFQVGDFVQLVDDKQEKAQDLMAEFRSSYLVVKPSVDGECMVALPKAGRKILRTSQLRSAPNNPFGAKQRPQNAIDIKRPAGMELTDTQERAIDQVLTTRKNTVISGAAAAGKTLLGV